MGENEHQQDESPDESIIPWSPWEAWAHINMIREQVGEDPSIASADDVLRMVQVIVQNMSCPHWQDCPCLLLEHELPPNHPK